MSELGASGALLPFVMCGQSAPPPPLTPYSLASAPAWLVEPGAQVVLGAALGNPGTVAAGLAALAAFTRSVSLQANVGGLWG